MKQDGKYGRVICARSRQKLSVNKEFFKIKEAKELKINVTNGTIALFFNIQKTRKRIPGEQRNAKNPLDKELSHMYLLIDSQRKRMKVEKKWR